MPNQPTMTANGAVQYRTPSNYEKWSAFNEKTFRHFIPEQAISLTEDQEFRFTLTKARYTSRVLLMFEGTFALTHASATSWATVKHRHAPYNLVKNIKVDIPGLATPINISGIGLNMINRCRPKNLPFNEATVTTSRNMTTLTDLVASSANTVTFNFVIEVPFMLNNRDYKGLINTQDQNLNCNFVIETGNAEDLFTATTGYTVGTPTWTCTPMVESYSPVENDLEGVNPTVELIDFDVVRMVQQLTNQEIAAAGEKIFKLQTGETFRRIIANFYGSTSATALTDAEVTKLQLSLNGSDTPIIFPSTGLKSLNHMQLGGSNGLPAGFFLFDFTEQGFINYGGPRDYINTFGLNEFWLRAEIASGVTGYADFYIETLKKVKSTNM
jgi:hypothetical protein